MAYTELYFCIFVSCVLISLSMLSVTTSTVDCSDQCFSCTLHDTGYWICKTY